MREHDLDELRSLPDSLARDYIAGIFVSTVHLPWLEDSFMLHHHMKPYETMCFVENEGPDALDEWDKVTVRYQTKEDALRGHQAIVDQIRGQLKMMGVTHGADPA